MNGGELFYNYWFNGFLILIIQRIEKDLLFRLKNFSYVPQTPWLKNTKTKIAVLDNDLNPHISKDKDILSIHVKNLEF